MELPVNSKIIRLENVPYYDEKEYDLFDEKDFNKFIKDVERRVRNSIEYRELIAYLKQNGGMNNCAIFKNVTAGPKSKIKIEVHHAPFTLYEIAMAVYSKRAYNDEVMTIDEVAKEVMYLHYFLIIGLIPLSDLAHKLTHEQILTIHPDKVFGKWQEFKDLYEDFLLPETKEKLETLYSLSLEDIESKNKRVLRFNPTYVQMDLDNALVDEQGLLKPMLVDNLTSTLNAMEERRFQELEEERLDREQRMSYYDNIQDFNYEDNDPTLFGNNTSQSINASSVFNWSF